MILSLSIVLAATPEQAWTAMEGDAWSDVGTKNTSVGEVRVRHLALAGVDCLEASAVTQLDVERMKAVVLDIAGNLEWSSADLEFSWVLAETASTIDYLQLLDNPPPISDRYWYLHGSWGPTTEGWALRWQHFDGAARYAEKHAELMAMAGGAVEVGFNVGSWDFVPSGDGTLARFRSCTDVGGKIPRWAGVAAARMMLPNNLEDLFTAAAR